MDMQRFAGKTVLVTGGARGIGRGIARRFAQEGASVAVADRLESVEQTAAELAEELGVETLAVTVDVTDRAQVEALYARVEERFGRLDVSVQNAGILRISPLERLTEEEWDATLGVNTKGMFLCCQQAAALMRRQGGGGRIVNSASAQARDGFVYTPHYAASKFGVMGMTQSLAKELAADGITVNAFCPGIIGSDMWEYADKAWGELLGDYARGELMAEWVAGIPMRRAGTPEDVAGLVAFLASDDASYITGQTVNVCGGLEMS